MGKSAWLGAAFISALLLTGCGATVSGPPSPTSTATLEATATAGGSSGSVEGTGSAAGAASGPITTAAQGSKLRGALMDAARVRLSSKSQFVVHQLYVQGPTALGDIEPASGSGSRMLVGFLRDGGGHWSMSWKGAMGVLAVDSVRASIPPISTELIDTLDWSGAVGPGSDGPANLNRCSISIPVASGKDTCAIDLYFYETDTGTHEANWSCTASTTHTKFYIDDSTWEEAGPTRGASYKEFRAYIIKGDGSELIRLNWVWKWDSQGRRYRFIRVIGASRFIG